MEKILTLAILLALAPAAALAGVTAQSPETLTATAAECVSGTAAGWDSLMEVRLKELHFNITPEFRFVLPDASVKLGLKQKLGDTVLDASTEYNYLYNKIRYDIKYSVEVYLTLAANLYDAVSFEQIYQNQKYIQRNKGFGLSVQSPEILDFIVLREEFRTDNYYFARLDTALFTPQSGYIMKLDTWLELDLNFCANDLKKEDRLYVNVEKSIPYELSPYNFLFLNIGADKKFDFDGGQRLSLKFNGGYLLEKDEELPIWQIFRMGGYDRMIGYNYDEFEGFYMDFFRIKYETPLVEKTVLELPFITLDSVRMFVIVDAGCAGSGHEVTDIANYSYSAGLGFIVELNFRKRTPVKMTFAVAQAIKQGKTPVFYFAHEF